MGLINTITYYINMIGIVAIVTLVAMIGVLYYFVKVKKVTAKEENINTLYFKREDSISYVPFKDIISDDGSLDAPAMVVMNNHIFVGGLTVRGFDYRSASREERIDAQVNSVQFFNAVEKPTTFRQSVKRVDLTPNIEEHRQISKKIASELIELEDERRITHEASAQYVEDLKVFPHYAERIQYLDRQIYCKRHMLDEVETLIRYMGHMSGDSENRNKNAIGQKSCQILFPYVFNPDEYSAELSQEEIYQKGFEGLEQTARSYAEALAACHFKSSRLTAREYMALIKKSTSPITGEDFSMDELLNSSHTTLIVSSDSLVEACKEKIGEDIFNEQMEAQRREIEEIVRRQAEERRVKGEALKAESFKKAYEELRREEALQGDLV